MKSLRTTVAAAIGGALLVAGLLVGASVAFADDADDADVTEEGTLAEYVDTVRESIAEMQRNLGEVTSLEALAAGIGIDLDELVSLIEEEIGNAIDERAEAGDIFEERADLLRDRLEAFSDGEIPFFDRPFPRLRDMWRDQKLPGLRSDYFDFDLGELRERLEEGLPLDEALEDLGFDLEDAVEDAVEDAAEDARAKALEHVDRLVEKGVISEERADELRERIETFDPSDLPFGSFEHRYELGHPFGEMPRMREFFGEDFSFDDLPPLEEFFDGELPRFEDFFGEDFSFEDLPPLEELFGGEFPFEGHLERGRYRGHPHGGFFYWRDSG